MRLSLIIPTHNRRDVLYRCLVAATGQDYTDYEVVVVDDASSDGTEELVQTQFPEVRIIRQPINRGPAAARNLGIREATGQVIAFTDDDCLLPGDFLTRLAEGYESHPEVAGVGGYLMPPDDVMARSLWARYEAYVTQRVYGAGAEPYLGGFECPAGGTHSVSYRRDCLEAVGCFDETFPVPGGEDADLKLRVTQAGGLLLYLPVRVIHIRAYDFHDFWRQRYTHGRGVVHFERKHQGRPPSAGRLILRAGVRLARWLPNAISIKRALASARLIAEVADWMGQFDEIRNLAHHSKSH